MKLFKVSLLALLSLIFIIGCSSDISNELDGAPSWVLIPESDGAVVSVGSAVPNAGHDISFQRQEAIADARDEMARTLSVKVGNMIKSYKGVTGSGDDATFDKSSESVSKQVANQTLVGSKPKNVWISKSGTMYILLILDTDSVIGALDKAIKSSFRNKKAIYQRFLASKAQGELDKELEKFEKQ